MAEVRISRIASLARKLPMACLSTEPIVRGYPFAPEIDNHWYPVGGNHLVRLDPDNRSSAYYLLVEAHGGVRGWVTSFEDEGWSKVRDFPFERYCGTWCPNLQTRLLRLREYPKHHWQERAYWNFELLLDMGFSSEATLRFLAQTGGAVFPALWWLIDLLTERQKTDGFTALCNFLARTTTGSAACMRERKREQILSHWQLAGIKLPTAPEGEKPDLSSSLFGIVEMVLSDPHSREVIQNLVEPEVFTSD